MKRPNILIALAALAAFTPVVRADDRGEMGMAMAMNATMNMPVEQRLMRIDLDVAIRHYEKLQEALRNSRLELLVNGSDNGHGEHHPAQEGLQRKIEILSKLTDQTRQEILELGQVLEKQAAESARATAMAMNPMQGAPSGFVVPGQFPGEGAMMGRGRRVIDPNMMDAGGGGYPAPSQFTPGPGPAAGAGVPGAPGAMNAFPPATSAPIPGMAPGAGGRPGRAMVPSAAPRAAAMPAPSLQPVPGIPGAAPGLVPAPPVIPLPPPVAQPPVVPSPPLPPGAQVEPGAGAPPPVAFIEGVPAEPAAEPMLDLAPVEPEE